MTSSQSIILAGGCFWCLEAIFKRLKGVIEVRSGYTGGTVPHPTYEAVCSGMTGHAEAVEIMFDPTVISLKTLLEVFWKLHDPTTLNRQGNDVGTQYRSAIFYADEQQKIIAEESKKTAEEQHLYTDPIVTEITPRTDFYAAEASHDNFYDTHRGNMYCRLVIDPKIHKLSKDFSDLLPN